MDFRILGPLEVSDGGRSVELRGPKVRALMAMLVLHANEAVSTDRLVEALWPDHPPDTAANTLQTYVSQLRKALGARGQELVVTRSPGYLLAVPSDEIDRVRFERLVSAGRAARAAHDPGFAADRLAEALALWRGEPLADFAFESFAQSSVVRLNELCLEAIEEQIDAELALGRHPELVGRLCSLVEAHPLRERLWAQLVIALYRCGRQGEALRAFADVRERLAEDLGIEPGAALKSLEEAVLRQSAELDWLPMTAADPAVKVVRHNLPPARSSFIGRHDEIAEVEKLVVTGGLVTVVGPGGAGKSRLAREVAQKVLHRFPDGVWLVDLASAGDASEVPEAIASVLDVHPDAGTPIRDTLVRALEQGRRLFVLDNCEHVVAPAAELVEAVLARTSGVTVLATSRQPLRIDGEAVWRIPPLPVPQNADAGGEMLADFDSVRLFVERATSAGTFSLSCENAAAVGELCRRLDGMPLAIELAASRSRGLTPRQLLDRLGDRFGLLTGGSRTSGRHETLRASVQWSHDLLAERERIVFRRLAVLAGEFSLEAAETACSGDGIDPDDVIDILATLVDRSLVMARPADDVVLYSLLESHRAYAAELLAQAVAL